MGPMFQSLAEALRGTGNLSPGAHTDLGENAGSMRLETESG